MDTKDGQYASVMLINERPYTHKQGTFEEARQDAEEMQVEIDHRSWGVQDLTTREIVYRVER